MQLDNLLSDHHLLAPKHLARRVTIRAAARDCIAAAISPATYIFSSFVLGVASFYPELGWPLLAYLNPSFWAQRDCYSRNTNSRSLKSFSNVLGSMS